jgi:hypothetical protein
MHDELVTFDLENRVPGNGEPLGRFDDVATFWLTLAGETQCVPAELVAKGTAELNAMVHPMPNFAIWASRPERFGLSDVPAADDAEFPAETHIALRRLWSVLQEYRSAVPQPSEALSEKICDAILRLADKQAHAEHLLSYERGWDWPDETWLAGLEASGIAATLIPSVVKHVEVERTRSAWAKTYRKHKGSPTWPTEVMVAVIGEIMEERGRQLAAMTDAMNRVAEAIFS